MDTHAGGEHAPVSLLIFQEAAGRDTITEQSGTGLEIFVIFTDAPGTAAAMRLADGLAQKLNGYIRLLLAQEVPYVLPVTRPPVPVEFLEAQVRGVADTVRLKVAAQVCLCRDKRRTLAALLRPRSLVVVGGKWCWWPTAAQKLARALRRSGHHVIFAKQR
jgi:hypothetical protein